MLSNFRYSYICLVALGFTTTPITANEIDIGPLGNAEKVKSHETDVRAAHNAYLGGMALLSVGRHLDTDANATAQAAFEEAIRLDPDYAQGYAGLGWAKWLYVASINQYASKDEAFDLAEKSLSLSDNSLAHRILAKQYFAPLAVGIYSNKRPDSAVAELEIARRLQPDDPDILADLATALPFAGRPGDALVLSQQATELNPAAPDWYFAASGIAYLLREDSERAISDLRRWSDSVPSWYVPYVFLASAYGLDGEVEAAKKALSRQRQLTNGIKLSADYMKRRWPMAATEEEIFLRGLRIAGAFD